MAAMHQSFDTTLSLLLIHLVPAVDRTTQNNIFNIAGALYAATLFLGVSNSSSVQVTHEKFIDLLMIHGQRNQSL